MPRWYSVTFKNLAIPNLGNGWPVVMQAANKAALEQQMIEAGFDKRYWGFEIHAYSVNGEDF